jgi:RNA polymerase sigma-70 factor (ECF subfamily)
MPTATPREDGLPGAAAVDREARFRGFVADFQDRAVRIAWRLVGGDGAAAEDVAQEAFLRAWRNLDRFRDDGAMAAWFFGILVNEARRHRRWRAVRARWAGLWPREPADRAPAPAGDPLLRQRIATAMDQLSQGQREAFVLVYLEGFTVDQVAVQLGKAPGTIKSHLHRALASLRTELGDLARTEPAARGGER